MSGVVMWLFVWLLAWGQMDAANKAKNWPTQFGHVAIALGALAFAAYATATT